MTAGLGVMAENTACMSSGVLKLVYTLESSGSFNTHSAWLHLPEMLSKIVWSGGPGIRIFYAFQLIWTRSQG